MLCSLHRLKLLSFLEELLSDVHIFIIIVRQCVCRLEELFKKSLVSLILIYLRIVSFSQALRSFPNNFKWVFLLLRFLNRSIWRGIGSVNWETFGSLLVLLLVDMSVYLTSWCPFFCLLHTIRNDRIFELYLKRFVFNFEHLLLNWLKCFHRLL